MLTGKTIGQLTNLNRITQDSLIPVQLDGQTYHVIYSGFVEQVSDLIPQGVDSGTTAVLVYGINVITTATTENFAVKLPTTPIKGKRVSVVNKSDRSIRVFPSNGGGDINGIVDGFFRVPNDGISYDFVCYENPSPGGWSTTVTPLSSNVADYPIFEISHTGGTETKAFGVYDYFQAPSIGIGSGINVDTSLILYPDSQYWHSFSTPQSISKLTVTTNILDTEADGKYGLFVGIYKALKVSPNGSSSGLQGGGVDIGGDLVGIEWYPYTYTTRVTPGSSVVNNPTQIGDSNTLGAVLDLSLNPNGPTYAGPIDAVFNPYSNEYYGFGIIIPATYPSKTYKFKFVAETV